MFSKKALLLVCLGAVLYAMLSYHFIFYGGSFRILKKSRLTLDYTIFNAQGKKPKSILAIDDLRRDGIGDVLVEMGVLTQDQLLRILDEYEGSSR